MISFRQHLVSLVAVFLALAVGIVLGGGPLEELGRDATVSAPTSAKDASARRTAAFANSFAAGAGPRLYAGGLKDRPVSLVTLPGSDDETVRELAGQVEAAGGYVASTYAVLPAMVNPSKKSLVDALGSQLLPQVRKEDVDRSASTYVRAGQLLGLVVASPGLPPAQASAVGQSLEGADLIDVPDSPDRAALVLVVLGDDVNDAILSGLLSGLAANAFAVVVAGDAASGLAEGDLATLRGSDSAGTVTTVDGVDTALGRVTAVLALIRSLKVRGGSFGAAGSDGSVPLG
ncbi:copper transporter [Nocardioides sp.]|uniref:copper transporter n=1 Tax=Nocardioides sp. TaxID=35761 RepID=UPI003564E05D